MSDDDSVPASVSAAGDELIALIKAGRKIEAIKYLREADGVGLKEAKEQVERLQADLGIESPRGGGCAGLLLLAGGLLCWSIFG